MRLQFVHTGNKTFVAICTLYRQTRLLFAHYTGNTWLQSFIIFSSHSTQHLTSLAALFVHIEVICLPAEKNVNKFFTIIKNKCVCYICSRMGALSFRTRMGTFHFCSRMGALFFSYTHGYVIIADAWLHSLRYNIHTCNTVYFASMYMAIFPAGNANINFPF